MSDLRDEVARVRFARWQQILWEGGAQTITWDELTRSEQVMEMDCAEAAIAMVLERYAKIAEQTAWHEDAPGDIASDIRALAESTP